MASKSKESNDLYIFDLSEEVKSTLELLYFDLDTLEEVKAPVSLKSDERDAKQKSENENECSACNIKLDEEDRRYHYKTDFHRFNLKRSIEHQKPISESEFDALVEGQSIESLSASDSESDSDEYGNEDKSKAKLETVFEKVTLNATPLESERSISYLNTRSPYILFKSPFLEEGKAFGVYKALFSALEIQNSPVNVLQSWSREPVCNQKSAMFMIGGGHFAGAIVSHKRKSIKGNVNHKESKRDQAVEVISSKTFHRYTTRRKQGGAQSASDNARGKANSAGSSMRRYNEQMLIKDVRDLLASWRKELEGCTYIFIRANGVSNRKTLLGYEGAILKANDPRIRSFPFTTKRPTTAELKKAWSQLTYLEAVDLPKVREKRKEPKEDKAPLVKKAPESQLTEDEKQSVELINLIKKQKAPLMISYLKKHNLSPNFTLKPDSKYASTPTLLHYSSHNNLNHMTQILLINLKADPTIQNDFGKTPYDCSGSIASKRVFQIARNKLGEDSVDWLRANVGPPKSKEDFEKEDYLEQERIKAEKKKSIEEELNRKTELELKKPTFSSSGRSGGPSVNQRMDLNGLSEQQKQRFMREQRARAAEARMKSLSNT
ncbi:uncharacterized protein PRCAT00002701001 [Priceomyces carsonii]|uniref:uncharacterized protein n=1 Tax=Priceomyces carsonii TaxID=28549 RepID=UPI002ED9CF2C|nr:unnamed protein product [Priceomyces carsonii]